MSKNNIILSQNNRMQSWLTIREAVNVAQELTSTKIKDSDIFRNALCGNTCLSLYFQSPIILQKVQTSRNKVKLRAAENSFTHRLCQLDSNCFLNGRNLIVSTEGEYIYPTQMIIDTTLIGHEYVVLQRLLARSLGIPLPVTGANDINYGISVTISGRVFQVFENVTLQERIKRQIMRLPKNIAPGIYEHISSQGMRKFCSKKHFPLHILPHDACFVIRQTELEKLINMPVKSKIPPSSSSRISTPLSRLFWLACKHNEAISPLIRQPYKLLSIFEQWASTDGITDHLSGDTLKTALKRGSPIPSSTSA
ncbi:hypothetical protein ABK905_22185 [Acerihabitans sp. KWT182]|uniref:Homing endonuclease LAGLIDADG domain-containing protein n=1 Tax=Acerihabitans sp. KWT182 TaxID=3157919 RepID=A0AAU7Q7X1_9GAMM